MSDFDSLFAEFNAEIEELPVSEEAVEKAAQEVKSSTASTTSTTTTTATTTTATTTTATAAATATVSTVSATTTASTASTSTAESSQNDIDSTATSKKRKIDDSTPTSTSTKRFEPAVLMKKRAFLSSASASSSTSTTAPAISSSSTTSTATTNSASSSSTSSASSNSTTSTSSASSSSFPSSITYPSSGHVDPSYAYAYPSSAAHSYDYSGYGTYSENGTYTYSYDTSALQAGAAVAQTAAEVTEEKDQNKKQKKILRVAAGRVYEDKTLSEFPENDFRIFCGDLAPDVNDAALSRFFSGYPSFAMARVIMDKGSQKSKGFGFASFLDPHECANALKELDGKYCGGRPVKLRRSDWKKRNLEPKKGKNKHLF